MTDIHSCSYYCTRPACVLEQRNELRDEMLARLESRIDTHQKQAEPVALTVAEIEQMKGQWSFEVHGDRTRYLVRMTEQAHGIGEKE